jgi:hypothetical protein
MFRNSLVFRIVGALLLVALIVGGGAMVYRAGMAQGISQAPAVATAISNAAENGQPAPFSPMYGREFGYGYNSMPMRGGYGYFPMDGGFSHGFFNPIGGILFFLFIVFLVGGFIKMMFFRGMMHRNWEGHNHTPWGRHWESGVPSMFEEWHKRAHGEKPEEESKKE